MKNLLTSIRWNSLSVPQRALILSRAGRGSHYAHRSFSFIPSWIREDVIRVFH